MGDNCTHRTCLGPICTQPSLPNRPLIGKAREKAEIISGIRAEANKLYLHEQKGFLFFSTNTVSDVAEFIRFIDRLIWSHITGVWRFKIAVVKRPSGIWHIRVGIRRAKQ